LISSIVSSGKLSDISILAIANNRCSANEEAAHNARIEALKEQKARPIEEIHTSMAETLKRRPFLERKAAFNLILLAGSNEASISADKVDNLIGALIVCSRIDGETALILD
jgi:hypothetical protein